MISRAQTIDFGIKAGLNLAEQTPINTFYYSNSPLAGATGGAIADIGFKHFSIQPGIFFSMKGESRKASNTVGVPVNSGSASTTSTLQIRLNYIELPVNFLIKYPLTSSAALHFGGGPYLGYGFPSHTHVAIGNQSLPLTIAPPNPDFGVDALAGVTVKHMLFDAGFSYGITNVGNFLYASHNMVFSFSVGYMFK